MPRRGLNRLSAHSTAGHGVLRFQPGSNSSAATHTTQKSQEETERATTPHHTAGAHPSRTGTASALRSAPADEAARAQRSRPLIHSVLLVLLVACCRLLGIVSQ